MSKSSFWRLFLRQTAEDNEGFALFELIILIVIIGITVAIVIPFFMGNSTNKAVEAEAKQSLGAMSRAQQAYFLEQNRFGKSIPDLAIGLSSETKNYIYSLEAQGDKSIQFAESKIPRKRSYVSAVFLVNSKENPKIKETVSIICVGKLNSKQKKTVAIAEFKPYLQGGIPVCHPETELVDRYPSPPIAPAPMP